MRGLTERFMAYSLMSILHLNIIYIMRTNMESEEIWLLMGTLGLDADDL